jgi:hypothetical protein
MAPSVPNDDIFSIKVRSIYSELSIIHGNGRMK